MDSKDLSDSFLLALFFLYLSFCLLLGPFFSVDFINIIEKQFYALQ
jgi:hypothetical protein